MKKLFTVLLLAYGNLVIAQTLMENQDSIVQIIANDTSLVSHMACLREGVITIAHLPQVCQAAKERRILIQFYPDCEWVVTSTKSLDGCGAIVSIASTAYGFFIENIQTQNVWDVGDRVYSLVYIMPTGKYADCTLTPAISKMQLPGQPLFFTTTRQ